MVDLSPCIKYFFPKIFLFFKQFLKYHVYEQMDRLYVGQVLPTERMKNSEN